MPGLIQIKRMIEANNEPHKLGETYTTNDDVPLWNADMDHFMLPAGDYGHFWRKHKKYSWMGFWNQMPEVYAKLEPGQRYRASWGDKQCTISGEIPSIHQDDDELNGRR